MAVIESPIIYNYDGTLTSNLQVIASNGPALGYSGIFLLYNNTTGNYTWNICLSNGSDACNGGPTVTIPQGASNSCATAIQTDGVTGVWRAPPSVWRTRYVRILRFLCANSRHCRRMGMGMRWWWWWWRRCTCRGLDCRIWWSWWRWRVMLPGTILFL